MGTISNPVDYRTAISRPSVHLSPANHRLGIVVVAATLCWSGILSAGDWRIKPRFNLTETVTDNLTLVERDQLADLVTQITPGLSVRGKGARLSSNIDYNLQHIVYADNTEFESTNHQLQGNADAELIEDWFYFDTRSTVSQQIIDNTGTISRNNRNRSSRRGRAGGRAGGSNRSDVITREFSPSIRHNFAGWLKANLRYTYDEIEYTSDQETGRGSSVEDTYSIRLSSGRKIPRMPLSLAWESRKIDYDSGRMDQHEKLNGSVSYVFSRKFRLTATAGTEDNSSPLRRGGGTGGGVSWSIGGTWKPSRRTSLSGKWGERSFGNTFDVSASHRRRRWNFKFNYDEEIRTNSQVQRDLVLVPLVDDLGEPVFDPITSSTILIPLDTPSVRDRSFVNRRMNSTLSYNGRRNRVRIRFFRNDREFNNVEDDELQTGLLATVTRPLSPRLGSGLNVSWRETESGTNEEPTNIIVVSPYISYGIGPHLSTRVSYEYVTRDGGSTGTDYVENALTARFDFHY